MHFQQVAIDLIMPASKEFSCVPIATRPCDDAIGQTPVLELEAQNVSPKTRTISHLPGACPRCLWLPPTSSCSRFYHTTAEIST
jgi:hypothetical protein